MKQKHCIVYRVAEKIVSKIYDGYYAFEEFKKDENYDKYILAFIYGGIFSAMLIFFGGFIQNNL